MSKKAIINKTAKIDSASDLKGLKKLKITLGIIVAAFAFILYAQSIQFDYAYDDGSVIISNKVTKQGLAGIPTILKKDRLYGYLEKSRFPEYRPAPLIIYAVAWQFFPNSPHVLHFINVLIYALSGFILFLVSCKLFRKYNLIFPFVCSLLYIAHPLHTEVVDNIKSLDEMLCFMFGLLSILFVLKYVEKKTTSSLVIACVSFFFSLLSKENGITFVIIIPLVIYFFTTATLKNNLAVTAFFAVLTGIYLLIRHSILSDPDINNAYTNSIINNSLNAAPDFITQKATTFYMLLRYIILLIFPHPLSCDYNFNEIKTQTLSDIPALAGILIYFGLLIYSVIYTKKKSIIAFGILFYLLTLAPVSNVFLKLGATMAERFVYTPSLGFCIILTYFLLKLTKTESVKSKFKNLSQFFSTNVLLFCIVGGILILYSVKTFSRSKDWHDNLTLFGADVKTSTNSAIINELYASNLYFEADKSTNKKNKEDSFKIAKQYLLRAIQIYPDFHKSLNTLGAIYFAEGNYDSAYICQKHAAELKPDDIEINNNYGITLMKLKKTDEALKAFDHVISLNPKLPDAYYSRGVLLMDNNRKEDALNDFNKTIEFKPKYVEAYENRGVIYSDEKKFDEAIKDFNKAIELKPGFYLSYNNRGNVFLNEKRYDVAIKDFDKAIELNPKYDKAYLNRGKANINSGNKDAACSDFIKAVSMGNKAAANFYNQYCK